MAFIGIRIPNVIGTTLLEGPTPGDITPLADMHITVSYLGKNIPDNQIIAAVETCLIIAKSTSKFNVGIALISHFEKKEEGYPIVGRIISPEIHKLKARIEYVLPKFGITPNKKFPIFKPHATISYSPTPIQYKIKPIIWEVSSITLWGGLKREDRMSADFDFLT